MELTYQRAVKVLLDLHANFGFTPSMIARELNRRGYRNMKGNLWVDSRICQIIANRKKGDEWREGKR